MAPRNHDTVFRYLLVNPRLSISYQLSYTEIISWLIDLLPWLSDTPLKYSGFLYNYFMKIYYNSRTNFSFLKNEDKS